LIITRTILRDVVGESFSRTSSHPAPFLYFPEKANLRDKNVMDIVMGKLVKRSETFTGNFTAVIAFSSLSILFSLGILAKLAHQATNGGPIWRLRSYDWIFLALQILNFATQAIVIYTVARPMSSSYISESLLKYVSALNMLGVVFANVQTLFLFSVLDLRITRERIRFLAGTFVALFFLLTSLELRNLIVAGSIDRISETEVQLYRIGTILIIVFAAFCLLYDNLQVRIHICQAV
jgi:hypothetical protein